MMFALLRLQAGKVACKGSAGRVQTSGQGRRVRRREMVLPNPHLRRQASNYTLSSGMRTAWNDLPWDVVALILDAAAQEETDCPLASDAGPARLERNRTLAGLRLVCSSWNVRLLLLPAQKSDLTCTDDCGMALIFDRSTASCSTAAVSPPHPRLTRPLPQFLESPSDRRTSTRPTHHPLRWPHRRLHQRTPVISGPRVGRDVDERSSSDSGERSTPDHLLPLSIPLGQSPGHALVSEAIRHVVSHQLNAQRHDLRQRLSRLAQSDGLVQPATTSTPRRRRTLLEPDRARPDLDS